ncbi:MAG TPA: hypothetical protein VEG08_13015 [Terriglobales bacterium]|nr:hypothetical protein [Terriglobales bacterium]
MSEADPPRRLGRSFAAVFVGLAAIVVLSLGTDEVLHLARVFPPWGQPMSDALFVLATIYRCVYAVAGCYLAARLAPSRPMRHALMLGVVGVVLSTAGAVGTWKRGPEFGPHWYPLGLIASSLPCAWLGGRLQETKAR